MDAYMVKDIHECKQRVADVLDTYVNKVPAIVLADFLDKLSNQLYAQAEKQYSESIRLIKESEVKEDGGQKSHRADSQ